MYAQTKRLGIKTFGLPAQYERFETTIFGLIPKKGGDARKMHKLERSLARQLAVETFRDAHREKVSQLVKMSTVGAKANDSTSDAICDMLSRMSFHRRPDERLSRYIDRSRRRLLGLGWLQGNISNADVDTDRQEQRANEMWDAVDASRREYSSDDYSFIS